MTSDELKKAIRSRFPTLKKPWWGRDVIECRDKEYQTYPHHLYINANMAAWQQIKHIEYATTFPDCDDFTDMKRGLFKLEWWKLIQAGEIPAGSAPIYASVGGYNPQGENHAYNFFLSDMGMFVSDYGAIMSPDGYRPMRMDI